MTDYPRFRVTHASPDDAFRHYSGARQVEFLFRLTDAWQSRAWPQRSTVRVLLAAMALALVIGAATAQEVVRVRGAIERVDGTIYVIKGRDGDILRLRLTPEASVAASVKAKLSDIRKGSYIGVAAVPQADGSLRALEAHIFHETMRGTGEGHSAWDLLPASTMTNATVQEVVRKTDEHSITLKYKDGEQRIAIRPQTVIVTYLPGTTNELVPGAVIFVPAASRQADGTLQAQRIMVGRDISPPQ